MAANPTARVGATRTAEWLVELLRPHTPFAESIVRRQIERAGHTVESLTEDDLPAIAPMIVLAAGMYLDPAAMRGIKTSLGVR